MTAAGLAERFHARRPGDGWVARCPAHDDHRPSLSIREGTGGRALLHCFAGCSVGAVCAGLRIRVAELFPHTETPRVRRPEAVRRAERQIADLRSRLTPSEREREVTVIVADAETFASAIVRALALAVEGEIAQLALE